MRLYLAHSPIIMNCEYLVHSVIYGQRFIFQISWNLIPEHVSFLGFCQIHVDCNRIIASVTFMQFSVQMRKYCQAFAVPYVLYQHQQFVLKVVLKRWKRLNNMIFQSDIPKTKSDMLDWVRHWQDFQTEILESHQHDKSRYIHVATGVLLFCKASSRRNSILCRFDEQLL